MTRFKRTAYDDALDAEILRWPGVTAQHEMRSKHRAVVLRFAGISQRVIFPASPSDHRGSMNFVSQVRATLRNLGAEPVDAPKGAGRPTSGHSPGPRVEICALIHIDPPRPGHGPLRDPWSALQEMSV